MIIYLWEALLYVEEYNRDQNIRDHWFMALTILESEENIKKNTGNKYWNDMSNLLLIFFLIYRISPFAFTKKKWGYVYIQIEKCLETWHQYIIIMVN